MRTLPTKFLWFSRNMIEIETSFMSADKSDGHCTGSNDRMSRTPVGFGQANPFVHAAIRLIAPFVQIRVASNRFECTQCIDMHSLVE